MYKSQKYIIVVTCVVLHNDGNGEIEVLILKRSEKEKEGPGFWTIPGGKVEISDWGKPQSNASFTFWLGALERAVVREVHEETSIKADNFSLVANRDVIFIRQDGVPSLVFTFYTLCRVKPCIMLSRDSTDYAWVTLSELKDYKFIGNVQEDIEAAVNEYALTL